MSQGQSSREPIILALSVVDHRQSGSGPTSGSGPNIKVAQGQLIQSQLSQGQVDSEPIEPGARRANLSRKAKQKQGKKQQQVTGSLRCEREAQRKRRHLTLPLRVANVCVCTSPSRHIWVVGGGLGRAACSRATARRIAADCVSAVARAWRVACWRPATPSEAPCC